MSKLNIKNNSKLKIGYVINDYSPNSGGTGVITDLDDEYIYLKGIYHDYSSHNSAFINTGKTNTNRLRREFFDYLLSVSGLAVFANMSDCIDDSEYVRGKLGLNKIAWDNILWEKKRDELLNIEKEIKHF